jgi:hypothetical protein
VVRREPPLRLENKRQSSDDQNLERGDSMNIDKKPRNDTKRVTSLPRQTINDHSILKKKAKKDPSTTRPPEFSKTATDGFGVSK